MYQYKESQLSKSLVLFEKVPDRYKGLVFLRCFLITTLQFVTEMHSELLFSSKIFSKAKCSNQESEFCCFSRFST